MKADEGLRHYGRGMRNFDQISRWAVVPLNCLHKILAKVRPSRPRTLRAKIKAWPKRELKGA